ncbi:hypothetical protein EDC96DRAFT_211878 [Choanephora cucurbitarum]|nr:hypothetical protein EDC96DRAFT_211878 [Choanephora cucurbitarum]
MPTLIKTKKKKRILPQKEVLDLEFVSAPSSRHLTDSDLLFNGPSEHDRHILSELWGSTDLNMRRPQVNIGKPQQMAPKDPPPVKSQLKDPIRKSDATWPMDLSHVSLLPSHLQQYHLKRRKQPDVSSEQDKQESVKRMQKDRESENEQIRLADLSEHNVSENKSIIHALSKDNESENRVNAELQDSQEEEGVQLESIQSIHTDEQSEIMQSKDVPSENVQGLNTEPHAIQSEENTQSERTQSKDMETEDMPSESMQMDNAESQEIQSDIQMDNTHSQELQSEDIQLDSLQTDNAESQEVQSDIQMDNTHSQELQSEDIQLDSLQTDNAESQEIQPEDVTKEETTQPEMMQPEDMPSDSIPMVDEEMQEVQSEDAEDIPQSEKDLSINCQPQDAPSKEDHAHSYIKRNLPSENSIPPKDIPHNNKTQQAEIDNKTQLIKQCRQALSTFVDNQTKRDRTHIFLRQRQAHIWIINQPKTRYQNCTKRKERLLRKIHQPYIVRKKIKAVHWQVNDL